MAGAEKNEDAALVWCADDASWTIAMLLDAHTSGESASVVMQAIAEMESEIIAALAGPVPSAFPTIQRAITRCFSSESLKAKCRQLRGETACLICAQKGRFLWWFSIGDCLVYVLHPELANLRQYSLNQRNFFEWIGKVNTFELPVPCYSSGVRELRQGPNRIVMVTDGLLECAERPFENGSYFCDFFAPNDFDQSVRVQDPVQNALSWVHRSMGRDSATIISWDVENTDSVWTYPSR
jgi:serine/threonine protein phosphatase PrpC